MDSTGLKKFPASAGRLRKLEVLSLSKNKLEDLPVTLGFCQSIKVLNLQGNQFRRIPGIILHLKNLKELRRLDNPLPPRWQGFASPPHVNVSKQSTSKNEKNIYNPESLQTLCTKVTFTHQIDYWKHESLGALQCKTLDSLASQFTVCEQCHTAIPNTGKRTNKFRLAIVVMIFNLICGSLIAFKNLQESTLASIYIATLCTCMNNELCLVLSPALLR